MEYLDVAVGFVVGVIVCAFVVYLYKRITAPKSKGGGSGYPPKPPRPPTYPDF